MLVVLDEKQKNDLRFLANVPEEVFAVFCQQALEYMLKGGDLNQRAFVRPAQALGTTPEVVMNGILALAHLLAEGSKQNLEEIDFLDSLLVLEFPDVLKKKLSEVYLNNRKLLRETLSEISFDLPHYVNIDWRLDVQLGTRCAHNQVEPIFTLRLDTLSPAPHSQFLQTDYTNLAHICSELQNALNESKTARARRIMRNVK